MDRKSFLRSGLQFGAVLGCPCLAGALGAPAGQDQPPAALPQPTPCPAAGGNYPNATTFQERADFAKTWIGRFMRIVDERLSVTDRQALMAANGHACAFGAYGPPDPAKTVSPNELVAQLQKFVGPENARREGDVVFFNYVKNPRGLRIEDGYCLCPLIEDGPTDLSATYCHCSKGYVAYMFERAIGRPVRVELLESLRGGGKRCRFAVHV